MTQLIIFCFVFVCKSHSHNFICTTEKLLSCCLECFVISLNSKLTESFFFCLNKWIFVSSKYARLQFAQRRRNLSNILCIHIADLIKELTAFLSRSPQDGRWIRIVRQFDASLFLRSRNWTYNRRWEKKKTFTVNRKLIPESHLHEIEAKIDEAKYRVENNNLIAFQTIHRRVIFSQSSSNLFFVLLCSCSIMLEVAG